MKLLGILVCEFLLTTAVFATNLTQGEKPIDALCIYEASNTQGAANLQKCGINAEKERKKVSVSDKLISNGFVGYDYLWKIDATSNIQGYSYYKSLGSVGNSDIVHTINNGGGSGELSTLSLITRTDNLLKVVPFKEGDRCNGGIVFADRKGQQLNYSISITSFDFLSLPSSQIKNVQSYSDLESCAACCKALAIFQRNITKKLGEEKLIAIDFSPYSQERGKPSRVKHQACFDKLLSKYIKKDHTKMTAEQFTQFIHQFEEECKS